ncbi:MAG: polyribonucleotide nucleotidyltransferase [Spirochaetes bacterium]|nr:polyribonucleotide nucleotidyltransferase [Spirochaetota bacterium]
MFEIYEKKIMLGGKEAVVKTGEYAHQSNASVVIQCGQTVVQAVATMSETETTLDFFPLTVEYNEALYAGGRIKSSKFVKREGKPSDEAILKSRLIDRSIRPMFSKDFKREVQVVINILASDMENPHDILGLNAAIIALSISDIPFDHNLAGIRLSKVKDEIIINPTYEQCDIQDYELVLAGNNEKIIMIECASNCVSDDEIEKGFELSYKYLGEISKAISDIQKEIGKEKVSYEPKVIDEEIVNRIKDMVYKNADNYTEGLKSKKYWKPDFKKVVLDPILNTFSEEEREEITDKKILEYIDYIYKKKVREDVLKNNKRVDGRDFTEIRDIEIKIDPIPQVHGSSMFRRGETQVLNILTLGAPGNEQLLEAIEGETKKRYIHHYNAPSYSVGEVGRFGSPGRREIGHGALAEKALSPVIPAREDFPYIIRLVSEVMSQNGSSSMASTCGSTITLMAGGIPIKEPVAGISIGLFTDEEGNFKTITDIIGIEDFSGDMDFKVAGTKDTITAIQMDTKIKGLNFDIIRQTLKQARDARREIIKKITDIIAEPRKEISKNAPKIETLQINTEDIGKVVGPSGKVIKQLIADYDVEINIDDSGIVSISGLKSESISMVKNVIRGIVSVPEVGIVYKGKVTRIMDYGAFIEIFPGKEGLCHVSQISNKRIRNPNDVLKIGQAVDVKLTGIDSQGRLNLSMNYASSDDNSDENQINKPFKFDRNDKHDDRDKKRFYETKPKR